MLRNRLWCTLLVAGALLAACDSGTNPPPDDGDGNGNDGITVEGRVADISGAGHQGVAVEIQGSVDTSGPDGSFSISGVSEPYDLTTYSEAAGLKFVHTFEGLTSEAPEVVPASQRYGRGVAERFETTSTATLEGTIPAVAGDEEAVLCAEGRSGVPIYGCGTVSSTDDDPGAYEFAVHWPAVGSMDVRLHVLLVDHPTGSPLTYDGYATRDTTVADGGTTITDVGAYDAVPGPVTLSGSFDPPDGMDVETLAINAHVSDDFVMPVRRFFDVGGSTSFSVPVPDIGEGYQAIAYTDAGSLTTSFGWDAAFDDGDTLPLPPTPTPQAPADGATGVTTDTTFSATGANGRALTFVFSPVDAGPIFAVTTTEGEASLPQTPLFPTDLPGNVEYEWFVVASPFVDGVNDIGTAWVRPYQRAIGSSFAGGAGVIADGGQARAGGGTFVTE